MPWPSAEAAPAGKGLYSYTPLPCGGPVSPPQGRASFPGGLSSPDLSPQVLAENQCKESWQSRGGGIPSSPLCTVGTPQTLATGSVSEFQTQPGRVGVRARAFLNFFLGDGSQMHLAEPRDISCWISNDVSSAAIHMAG